MKQIILSCLFVGLAFGLASCEETKAYDPYHDWEKRNNAFIDSLETVFDSKKDPALLRVEDERHRGYYIYYKVLESGDQTQPSPFYTSTVSVFYRGMLIDEGIFGKMLPPKHLTTQYKLLPVFDQNFTGDNPTEFDSPAKWVVSSIFVSGYIEALQWMHPGDRWEIYIPWRCAYGESGNSTIHSYSTLIFDLKLLAVTQY